MWAAAARPLDGRHLALSDRLGRAGRLSPLAAADAGPGGADVPSGPLGSLRMGDLQQRLVRRPHLPGYSLLYPPLGAWLGPELLGALRRRRGLHVRGDRGSRVRLPGLGRGGLVRGPRSTVARWGRITFALGLALGLGAILRPATAPAAARAALAALSGLGESRGGGVRGHRRRRARRHRAPPPRGAPGDRRARADRHCSPSPSRPPASCRSSSPRSCRCRCSLPPRSSCCRRGALLRAGILLYAADCVVGLHRPTPVGGNAVRLGTMFAGPVMALGLAAGGPSSCRCSRRRCSGGNGGDHPRLRRRRGRSA